MGKKGSPAIVGAFVLGALALAVVGVLVFGSGKFFRHTVEVVMYFPGSVDGLSTGAPVKFKGVDIGTVTNIQLVLRAGKKGPEARIPVYAVLDPSKIVTEGQNIRFPNPEARDELINRGMRAQLQSQSMLTGLLFIQLDFFPDTQVHFVEKQPSDPPEIPTIPTALEQASTQAREIINDLRQIDFKGMVDEANRALAGLTKIANDPALRSALDQLPGTMKNLNGAVDSANALLRRVERQVDPLSSELHTTLVGAQRAMGTVEQTASAATTLIEPGSPLDHDLRQSL
ncbi:MAG TPA: MlaD family protein, partial [Candidatus Dormibacteraeota bacterium]|nr:MlaD family protein [Candidatus Dormibacteraeota bacterium]